MNISWPIQQCGATTLIALKSYRSYCNHESCIIGNFHRVFVDLQYFFDACDYQDIMVRDILSC